MWLQAPPAAARGGSAGSRYGFTRRRWSSGRTARTTLRPGVSRTGRSSCRRWISSHLSSTSRGFSGRLPPRTPCRTSMRWARRPFLRSTSSPFRSRLCPSQVLEEIMAGARDVAEEAGIPILGGHSIEDTEPKFGWVVTGTTTDSGPVEEQRRRTGRRADPDQADRNRYLGHRRKRRRRRSGRLDSCQEGDANPECRRRRSPACGAADRSDRCDRLRATRTPAGNGVGLWGRRRSVEPVRAGARRHSPAGVARSFAGRQSRESDFGSSLGRVRRRRRRGAARHSRGCPDLRGAVGRRRQGPRVGGS